MNKIKTLLVLATMLGAHLFPQGVQAQQRFSTEYDITYEVLENGENRVNQNIFITNLENDVIATTYSLTIRQIEIYDIVASDQGGKIEVDQISNGEETTLSVKFNDYIIGEGRQNKLSLSFKTRDIASQVGEVWNINIPRTQISESTTLYNVQLIIPETLGPKIFLSPTPIIEKNENGKNLYFYTKESLKGNSLTAAFGAYQLLNFRLTYQIENPYILRSVHEIALPPDIKSVQQVRFDKLDPAPNEIKVDGDGNFIAIYKLKPKQKVDVDVIGAARIAGKQINPEFGGGFEELPKDLVNEYTNSDTYWETTEPGIMSIASDLKDNNMNVTQNAQKIYNYLIEKYDYDYNISAEGYTNRRGAYQAFRDLDPWACMEFTDTFITLARTMGIPSRELNGFAFSSVDEEKPLSISFSSGDYLHAWPQFYDPNFGWVQVDPTWGKTSGIDYFSVFDTNHFVFVQKGLDSEYPLPAGAYRLSNDKKLVEVEFSRNTDQIKFDPKIEVDKTWTLNIIQLIKGNRRYKITNTGNTFVYTFSGNAIPPNQSDYVFLPKGATSLTLKDFNGSENNFTF